MLRTHTNGELRLQDTGKEVTLCGWAQTIRNKGAVIWIDLRDRWGLTQLIFEEGITSPELLAAAAEVGREWVLQATGQVVERYNKNPHMPTGDVEVRVTELTVLNRAKTPPFQIEDETDGGEELRAKYRYLDLRRTPVRNNLVLRHKLAQETRRYLDGEQFLEVETPVLIKSTPEGARDFVVPSRMNPGEFYALPQSPQTFKQLLMVSGFERYFQIVKCFRDEDLRADRQPEFTQIDCEMAFVTQEDVLRTFEGLIRHLFKTVKGIDIGEVPRMTYDEAMRRYGSDKPDIRFGMEFTELNDVAQNKGFQVFDQSELVVGIAAPGCAEWTRKQLDALTDFVKRPQIGMKGLVWVRYNADGSLKSSVDKFYSEEDLKAWAQKMGAQPGDLLLVLSGDADKTRKALSELRLHLGGELGLRKNDEFKPLWVLDFPLLEWDEETGRYHAMHHPFTSPKPEDMDKLESDPGSIRANAYDLAMNGVEIGGGSIRIHDRATQARMFKLLGFSEEEARKQFGFLMEAFEYGAPPHGGIAFGFDRLCSLMGGQQSIRDFIAFPKNNSGRDVMIDTPSTISEEQLRELELAVKRSN
ncbi:aspartate--tRNA ligase [Cesiribacter andamanensis]|uniref:Aspartate--tRNA ligase n=1 Tax=Cesiribacter andamanensis AMV16 TaxID=1279009 RepID=M7NWK8_9BACT|nr:aspartate--tRNA ligase [Cesiribacter andamanensis]EMR02819.1 Aspartate--tRNA ligase [Cesiribacter andamanensis AMV16]